MNIRVRKSKFSHLANSDETHLRACGYFRVSTGRQAESNLWISDQRKQYSAFCDSNGHENVAEFVEAGATATDDNRPEFQKMIERACDDDHPYDAIVVHSPSRFFRDGFGLEMYVRKLAKAGVRLLSITQALGDDPAQVLMRQMIGMFDEYQSRENGKNVLRVMKENARQGFHNGSQAPLGYKSVEIEKRGNRVKKKLAIDPVEAEIVKRIFQLYRVGDGKSGPLGIKNITKWLNERGYRTRNGARFGVGSIHVILTNCVYSGQATFNKRDSKTLRDKPTIEHITVEVDPIIPRDEFDAVQMTLKSRDPRVTAPRTVTGPILLTGLATCATCNGAMTLRTGTSKTGKVHKYYTCSVCARKGKVACKGRSIPMAKLDTLVVEHLVERLFQPERLTAILASIASRRADQAAEVGLRVSSLQTAVTDAEEKLKRLYKMVKDGLTDLDEM